MIRFACPSCSSTFTVSDEKAGKTSNCPKCKAQFVIPGEGPPPLVPPVPKNAPITIDPCPKCRTQLSVEPADLGTEVECPTCRTVFKARKAGTGSKPILPPPPVTKSRVDDDEPVRRRSRDDDEEDDDDRPRRRPSSRRDDGDDDDDRPRRRSSRRDTDDDYDDDFDRPRRRPKRKLGSGSNEGQGLRVTSSVFGFIIGGLTLICGVAVMVVGGAVLDAFTGVGRGVANAPPPMTQRGFPTNPNAPNPNAAAGAAIAGAGWLTGGVVIGCGLVAVISAIVYIVGGIGLLQRRTYGKILTIIAAVFSVVCVLFGFYSLINAIGLGATSAVLMNLLSTAVYTTHAVTSFMACFGSGSHNFR